MEACAATATPATAAATRRGPQRVRCSCRCGGVSHLRGSARELGALRAVGLRVLLPLHREARARARGVPGNGAALLRKRHREAVR